jgi:hypothetical protein
MGCARSQAQGTRKQYRRFPLSELASHFVPPYAPTLPCARLRLRFVFWWYHHHNQHSNTITTSTSISIFVARPLEVRTQICKHSRAAFDISLHAHWDKKVHRLFAPVALPSSSDQPRTLRTFTTLYYNANLSPAYRLVSLTTSPSPPCVSFPPSAPSLQHHNNAFNTSSNVAPRAYTSYAHARSPTRQLRAILSPPFEA